ncbi:GTP-binding protein [Niabella beijingensis]|uniref:GTP-binding protein n=1 Tax=Niabella beijingensis TaxID=2872700 RepID=UPI001CC110A6|nr:GTP-binding protein [Niabella beijingensis]MBZ4187331.1 cobalamin synthesis protein P47K [Niabella beijingensis]
MKLNKTKLIFTGGFLGAGKTTLLQVAAAHIAKSGKTVGLITNDQADALVDTQLLLKDSSIVREISGSCFCCNYNGFVEVLHELMDHQETVDVIIAEPVGSCTDISATILQPLKDQMQAEVEMAPFTVLADPEKLEQILDGGDAGMHPSAAYIYRKQLEESDLILVSKTDTVTPERLLVLTEKVKLMFPDQKVLGISTQSGEGVEEWLDYVLESAVSGSRIVEVDYAVYAEGEAILGWLNAAVLLQGTGIDWDRFLKNYFSQLNGLLGEGAAVGHIKIMLESGKEQYIIGNQTGPRSTMQFRGAAGNGNIAQMTINARVELDPEKLKLLIFEALAQTVSDDMFYEIRQCEALSPGYPRPEHKYSYIVA